MAETRKSAERRKREGWFEKFVLLDRPGIDIGCGSDPLNAVFRRFDHVFGDGDATLMQHEPDEAFWTVYASHVLEHVYEPLKALRNWWRILRPGGHLIVCVPHRDLYEKRKELPSQWNEDHKTFWLPDRTEEPATWNFRETLLTGCQGAIIKHLRVLDADYEANDSRHPGGEYSIEAVLLKPVA